MKKSMFWGIGTVGIVLVGCLSFFVVLANRDEKSVQVMQVSKGDMTSYLSVSGTVEAGQTKSYYGLQQVVKKIYVKLGQRIEKGEKLVSFDSNTLKSQVYQAQLQYENSLLNLKQVEEQQQQLLEAKNTTQRNLDDVDYQIQYIDKTIQSYKGKLNTTVVKKVQALVAQKAALEQQKVVLTQQLNSIVEIPDSKVEEMRNITTISKRSFDNMVELFQDNSGILTAPFDGVVTALNGEEGATNTNPTVPLLTLQNVNTLKVEVQLGKYEANQIVLGAPCIIHGTQKKYRGEITYIAPSAQQSIGLQGQETHLLVEVTIREEDTKLIPGFDADVDILINKKSHIVKIPTEAVISDSQGQNFVYVVSHDKTLKRVVTLGIQNDSEIEVTKGILPGESVILNPSEDLRTGEKVSVQQVANR